MARPLVEVRVSSHIHTVLLLAACCLVEIAAGENHGPVKTCSETIYAFCDRWRTVSLTHCPTWLIN